MTIITILVCSQVYTHSNISPIPLAACSQSTRSLYHPAPEIYQTPGGSDFCIVDGVAYRAGERIPRESPCHICLCHLGRAECSWMACPVAPEGCYIFHGKGYCNPTLYVCRKFTLEWSACPYFLYIISYDTSWHVIWHHIICHIISYHIISNYT